MHAPVVLGPPVVLPILVAVEHALQPLKRLVPAAFTLCSPDQPKGLDAPLLALRRVVGPAQAVEDVAGWTSYGLVERFDIHLLVQKAFRDKAVELVFVEDADEAGTRSTVFRSFLRPSSISGSS